MFDSILKDLKKEKAADFLLISADQLLKLVIESAEMARRCEKGEDIGSETIEFKMEAKGSTLVAYTFLKGLAAKSSLSMDEILKRCMASGILTGALKLGEIAKEGISEA